MKLLAITAYYKPAYLYGGPVRSEAALFESLAKMGVEVRVVTTNANGAAKLDVPLLTPRDVGGVQVIYCPTRPAPGSDFYSPEQVREAKRRIPQADIVNLQTFWGYATPALSQYCINHHVPYYVSLRGQLMDYAMRQTSWLKRIKKHLFLRLFGYRYLNGAAALHCTSELEAEQLKAYPVYPPAFLVPNSFDLSAYQQLPAWGRLREQYGIPPEALVMVMIGRLDDVKNPHIGVAALVAAQQLPVPVHLLMVGPDEYHLRSALENQARQAGCFERLHFTGLLQKDALLQAMADSDLMMMPSQSENFGMSAAECMAVGLPILTSDIVPVGKWAKQAKAGETAACTEEAFRQAAVSLLKNPEGLKAMGRAGKAAAFHLFDHKAAACAMFNHLERIVCQHKRQHA